MREGLRSGLDYVNTATDLLQRVRSAHQTKGLFEAAEIQFWWSKPRRTDTIDQLFWFDDNGRPVAAVLVNDFGDGSSLLYEDPMIVVTVMPDASSDDVAHVVDRGLAHVAGLGIEAVELEVDQVDETMRSVLFDRGFEVKGDGLVECWLDAAARPAVTDLAEGYRLVSRQQVDSTPHHMNQPGGPDRASRLNQLSLYRSDLDLLIVDNEDSPAGYGMFWYDPVTATGVVEPMRTLDEHQQRGLARHILTSGVDRLAVAGAKRISIGYEPDNPASGHLYRSLGFEPHRQTDLVAGRVQPI